MISVRWWQSSWMQFSSLFLKSSMTLANNWRSIGWISWRMASFKPFNVRGLCKHAISNTPKGKNHTLKDRESEGATVRLRNGKWGARETCFEQWSLTRLQCALWHHFVESGQLRGKECRPPCPPPAYLLSTTHSKDIRFPWITLYIPLSEYTQNSITFSFLSNYL